VGMMDVVNVEEREMGRDDQFVTFMSMMAGKMSV